MLSFHLPLIMWQDAVLTIINFSFILTLTPAIIRNYKLRDVKGQSLYTYVSTAILLTIMAYIFITLKLYLTSISTLGTAVAWYILVYQKMRYNK